MERPDYTRYWEAFTGDTGNAYMLESLKTADSKGDKASYLKRLIEEAKAEGYPKLAEKAIIRRLKRLAK